MADPDFLEIGSTGLNRNSGQIFDEKLKNLAQPRQRFNTYREMVDNDPVIGGVRLVISLLIRQTPWVVLPFKESEDDEPLPEDIATADFVTSCFADLDRTFDESVQEILSFLDFGYDIHEPVFKIRNGHVPDPVLNPKDLESTKVKTWSSKFSDGKVGWARFSPRAQETIYKWILNSKGDVLGIIQQTPPKFDFTTIPRDRFLHFRTSGGRNNNPEGKSTWRNAYRPWYFKKTIEEIQAVGIERDLAGLPVMYVPESLMKTNGLSSEEQALRSELEQMLRNLRRGDQDGVMLPQRQTSTGADKLFELTLLSSGGRRQFDTGKILEYYDRRIAMMAVADFILLGHESVGSFALADAKTSIFSLATDAWLEIIAEQFNRHAIPQLLRVNNMDETRPPKLSHGDIETINLEELGKYIKDLSGAGMTMFPHLELENHLRDKAGLPELDELLPTPEPVAPSGFGSEDDDDDDDE